MSAVLASPTTILTSGDPGWDDARQAWSPAVDQHPVVHLGIPGDADYALFAAGLGPIPQAAAAVARSIAEVQAAMRPWAARQMYLNLAGTSRDPASFWTPQAYDQLRRIKAAVDPGDLIRSNHPVPPASNAQEGSPS